MLAFLLVVPTLFAAASGDWNLASWLFAASLVPALALGIGARVPPAQSPLQANEALVVAALAFIVAAALMSPVLAAASGLPLSDAWFEAVSGVTTTGLTMVTRPEKASPAFLFARSWMQWFSAGSGSLCSRWPWPSDEQRICGGWPIPFRRKRTSVRAFAPMRGTWW
jgi:trk system potassium uptake protein TrkH